MYACLNNEQTRYLRTIVKGKVVADLGCGDGTLTRLMARWGASVVHGVDKEMPPSRNSKNVRWHTSYFAHWKMPPEVELAVVSWPRNGAVLGLVEHCFYAREIVYIGKNTDGTVCGTPCLFQHLSERVGICHIPDRKNVLIHYGSDRRPFPRSYYHEEYAGIHNDSHPLIYDSDGGASTMDGWEKKVRRA